MELLWPSEPLKMTMFLLYLCNHRELPYKSICFRKGLDEIFPKTYNFTYFRDLQQKLWLKNDSKIIKNHQKSNIFIKIWYFSKKIHKNQIFRICIFSNIIKNAIKIVMFCEYIDNHRELPDKSICFWKGLDEIFSKTYNFIYFRDL